jgi:hypothetical protein
VKQSGLRCLLLIVTCLQFGSNARGQTTPAPTTPVAIERVQAPPPVVARLELIGAAGQQINISSADIRALPQKTVQVHNAHTGANETYQGVELSLLLTRLDAPLGQKLHGKALAMYVVAEGTNQYRVVYSLAEVDPAFHNGTVIVADREAGQPITKDGPFKLVNTDDKRPARWVRNLASIRLSSSP